MSLEVIKRIKVEFHDAKYISINAKQYDRSSRFILVTCYNNGELYPIDNTNIYAYIRYRKPDDLGVFNSCKTTDDGEILVELTEQMLAVAGKCYADIIIVNNNPVEISENTGKLIIDDNSSIVSTMTFCINVLETPFDNTEIESSYEYNALNDLMIKATEDYSYVMKACKISEDNAKESEINAKASEEASSASENNAKISEQNAKNSETKAAISEQNALTYQNNALDSATKAANDAAISDENVKITFDNVEVTENNVLLSKSYAIGETDIRENEDFDNAKYYCSEAKAIRNSLDGSFAPMGTIEFSQLQSVPKDTGYVYHINDAFVTDDTFKCGAGVNCPSGTNVYYTSDGYWDYFVYKDLTGDMKVTDDDDGNVVIEFRPNNSAVDNYDMLNQMVEELQGRIAELENQTVLGIVE